MHVGSQTPTLQPTADAFAGTAHTSLHAPQLLVSVCSFTQLTPHWLIGGRQLDTQLPPLQTIPVPHTVPHVPQLFGSLLRFAQLGGVVSVHTE